MRTVAIVGVGLIGGSFGLALRAAGFEGEIIGVSSAPAIAAGLEAGAISGGASLQDAVRRADLIYLAQPVDRILNTLEIIGPLARPECMITDAGSTKLAIVQKAAECLPSGNFLGGHPMAGKEQRGASAAEASLFRARPYVLTPSGDETNSMAEFSAWLDRIGAKVMRMPAAEHDRTVAFTSHLPQLLSTALGLTLAKEPDSAAREIFGPGLLDMTRLALSAPDLWVSILSTNKAEVSSAIDAFIKCLTDLKNTLDTPELSLMFQVAATFAYQIRRVPL